MVWTAAACRTTTPSDSRMRTLAEVAQSYAETVGQPGQREAMAEHLGYDQDSIPRLVKEARQTGVLTPTTRGRAGGSLTLKGAEALGLVRNAWEHATPEQRRAAVELKRRRAPFDAALREGQVTEAEYREVFDRLQELPTELLLRPSTREQVDADLARLAAVPGRR